MTEFDDIRATPNLNKNKILFTAGGTTLINAPPQHVFNTITDFASYSSWNRDTPTMMPDSPPPIQAGSTITMKTVMQDQNRSYDIPIEILTYEAPNSDRVFVLAWRGKLLPSWFAVSERVQEVRPIDGDTDSCEVCNWESMAGWGAYVFKYVMGIPGQMKTFNRRYLEDLKKRAEETYRR